MKKQMLNLLCIVYILILYPKIVNCHKTSRLKQVGGKGELGGSYTI